MRFLKEREMDINYDEACRQVWCGNVVRFDYNEEIRGVELTELCDEYYQVELTLDQFQHLINELQKMHNSVKELEEGRKKLPQLEWETVELDVYWRAGDYTIKKEKTRWGGESPIYFLYNPKREIYHAKYNTLGFALDGAQYDYEKSLEGDKND
jgi:hypothetical protein